MKIPKITQRKENLLLSLTIRKGTIDQIVPFFYFMEHGYEKPGTSFLEHPEQSDQFVRAELESETMRDTEVDLFPGDTPIEKILFDLKKIAETTREADELLIAYGEKEPKVRELLNTPQSADKHAEGPKIVDHYRCIFTALKMIEKGLLRAEDLADSVDIKGIEKEWNATLDFIRQHPKLMLAFAIGHDLGKVDFAMVLATKPRGEQEGFLTKTQVAGGKKDDMFRKMREIPREKRDVWLKKYDDLYKEFAAKHQDMEPIDVQKAFFDEYGVTVTYIGHERGAELPENQAIVERLVEEMHLSDDEKKLLYFSILHHVSGYLTFARGVEDYAKLSQLAEEAGLDPAIAMRKMQADMMIDGILGARKREENIPGLSVAVGSARKFFEAEQQYPAYRQAEQEKTQALQEEKRVLEICRQIGLRGEDLKAFGFATDPRFSRLIKAIGIAIRTGNAVDFSMYDALDATMKSSIEERVEQAKQIFKQ